MAKKDPREVELQRELKDVEKCRKVAVTKTFKKNEVAARVAEEYADLKTKMLKLRHFLWTNKITDSGDVISTYTEAANAIPGKQRQLLVRQYKAMSTYADILGKRLALFTNGEAK